MVRTAPLQVKRWILMLGSTAASAKKTAQANISAATGATSARAISRRLFVDSFGCVRSRWMP
jgi:hypothetical protein